MGMFASGHPDPYAAIIVLVVLLIAYLMIRPLR